MMFAPHWDFAKFIVSPQKASENTSETNTPCRGVSERWMQWFPSTSRNVTKLKRLVVPGWFSLYLLAF
jgi:hypothetical protein